MANKRSRIFYDFIYLIYAYMVACDMIFSIRINDQF